MTFLSIYLAMMTGAVCSVIALTAMRRREKHNIGKLGWLFLVLLTPPIGLVLFIFFGGKRISAEHSKRKQLDLPQGPDDENLDGPLAAIAKVRGLAPPSKCNRFEWFHSPEKMKCELIELIRSAETRLFVHTFILVDDDLGNDLIEILTERANEGVEVRLMVDGFGSFLFPAKRFVPLEKAGGKVTRFKPLSKLSRFAYSNFRNHRKLVCVDGYRAIIGGANFVQYEATTQPDEETWIDYFARVEGIAARQLEAVFVSDWNFTTGDHVGLSDEAGLTKLTRNKEGGRNAGDSRDGQSFEASHQDATALQIIPIGPDGPDEILDDIWLTTINRANWRVWLISPYFVPPPNAMGALMMAARRGLDVRVLFPSESDISPADLARHDYADDLAHVGATILRYPKAMVHAKMLIVDDDSAFVGSANFDMRSFFLNYELTMAVLDEKNVAEMARWYEQLSAQCVKGPKPATWRRRGLRVLTRIIADEL